MFIGFPLFFENVQSEKPDPCQSFEICFRLIVGYLNAGAFGDDALAFCDEFVGVCSLHGTEKEVSIDIVPITPVEFLTSGNEWDFKNIFWRNKKGLSEKVPLGIFRSQKKLPLASQSESNAPRYFSR
mgnify:CR=1 FL=1